MFSNHRTKCSLLCLLFAACLLPSFAKPLIAEPIGSMERFALAADREAMLAELIPGSEEFYFYHCLHYQNSGQLERSEAMIRDWLTLHQGRETASITAMIDRQRLLTYGDSPQRTIDHLIRRLGINLNHAPPPSIDQRRFPSQFDSDLIQIDRLVKDALRRNETLKPVGMQYLADLYRNDQTEGIKANLGEFLERVDGPYIDGLDELIAKELSKRAAGDRRFGDRKSHQFLTLAELNSLATSLPEIADDNAFVDAVLRRMRPGADSDASQQTEVRIDYLTRVEEYAQSLPPSYNSLKAAAAFRLLEANLTRGVFDRALLERYLQLPRVSPIVHRQWAVRGIKADLGQDFMAVALLPPIGNEEPVVRAHLEHFLRDAESTDAFDRYLQPDYLRRVFAETKLLAGVGSEQRWYKLLSPAERKAIRDAVVLRITADNPSQFAADQPTELNVDLKNVDELVIRIYEINTASYYRTNDKRIDTDIDLDGLVATAEKQIAYNQPAVIRHRERLQIPEISGRGVWIVDLFGKGVRARALVRRGSIEHVASSAASGMVFTIIDENRKPIPTATMWVGSREFVSDDRGRIVIPPAADVTSRTAIISDSAIARQIKFLHQPESYVLTAGMHIDRTQLQAGEEVELLIRPRLISEGNPVDSSSLRDVQIRIEAKDLEGISTTHQVDNLKLESRGELVIPLRVPPRLVELNVSLMGKMTRIADGQEETLTTSHHWDVAGIRATSQTRDAFLTRDGDDYVIEVRGRNGEIIPRATVSVSLETDVCGAAVDQTLQADDAGRVRLGPLAAVETIRFSVASGVQHTGDLRLNRVRWADQIHTTADRSIQLPLANPIEDVNARYRLLELRDGTPHSDHSEQISIADGLLKIDSLSPGDYRLLDRADGRSTQIAIVAGPVIERVATGQIRHESMSAALPLGIASVERTDQSLKIRLAGETEFARVHLYGSRYLDAEMPFGQLDLPLPSLISRRVSIPRCGYISDLRLGDEYQYVLNRRYARKYPGVMLPQPGVILNPWETEETTNVSQTAMAGDAPAASAPAQRPSIGRAAAGEAGGTRVMPSSDYAFLADSGVVIANLRPDQDGVITIENKLIEGLPILLIVACDPATMVQRTVTAPLNDVETVDLRLSKALDAAVPMTFRRGVSIASPNEPLDLNSLGSAQVQVYASVGQLLKLYRTMIDDPRLADFEPLGTWHLLDRDAKLEAYGRLASHELHLFLRFHDPSFFGEVIQPYLRNKKEKQFIDHWLLGDDLDSYTTLWRYNQLNAAERALLAMRLPQSRQLVRRQLREIIDLRPVNHAVEMRGIETALRGQWFDKGGGLGGNVRSELSRSNVMFDRITPKGQIAGEDLRRLGRSRRGQAKSATKKLGEESEADEKAAEDAFFGDVSLGLKLAGGRPFYRDLESTKQWAESQWDRERTVGGPSFLDRIDANAFWADLAALNSDTPVVSTNLLRPIENRHAALVALAMCGLPLSPGEVGLPTGDQSIYRPAHPVAVITKRLQQLDAAGDDSSILIGQRFESLDQASSQNRRSVLPAEPTEFLTGVAYRGKVVVSNPTAAQRVVDIFWQLPAGSLPLSGSQITDSRTITLEPFAVQAIEYQFYFPAAGDFTHYPANVADGDQLIAQSSQKSFKVVDQPSEQQAVTWQNVARAGTPKQIGEFLAEANLRELDWMLIAHRMNDQDVYQTVIKILGDQKITIADLWAYGFKYRDEQAMRAFLSVREDLVARVGPVFSSPLLKVEPIQRHTYELLEYAPLVRGRIHRLGEENQILNPTFLVQYQSFVRLLGYSTEIAEADKLVLSYYLLIQNRITESIERFNQINREKIESKLQYDYLAAYLAMHQENFDRAEEIAKRYADHPVPRWNLRFESLRSQLKQRRDLNQPEKLVSLEGEDEKPIAEGSGDLAVMDRQRRQADAAQQQPEVLVRVEGDALRIDHRNAKELSLRFYAVDLELLFSKAPFVREDLQRMAMVKPTREESISFDDATGVGRYVLDDNLRRQTLLVEVESGASRSTALYYGGDITTFVSESYGQLQTTDTKSRRPISAAYVKVFARYPDGSVRFHKDGYTDARGRFDYASVSASDARAASRYAILVLSEEQGATLHDVAAPTR